jgi:hypothetical protein
MRRRSIASLLFVASLGAPQVASAEDGEARLELAIPPAGAGADSATDERRSERRGSGEAGVRGTFGRSFTEGVSDGWYGRFELDALVSPAGRGAGPVAGALVGGELWLADDAVGGGLPMSFYFGYRTPTVFSSIGLGLEWFVYDDVHDDGGFGIAAPFAATSLGVDLGPVKLLADARVLYRWQWGAADRAQALVGLSLVHVFEQSSQRNRAAAWADEVGSW